MGVQFSPAWEFYSPDPEVEELLAAARGRPGDYRAEAVCGCGLATVIAPRRSPRRVSKSPAMLAVAAGLYEELRDVRLVASRLNVSPSTAYRWLGSAGTPRRAYEARLPRRCVVCDAPFVPAKKSRKCCSPRCGGVIRRKGPEVKP
jgi:hypothetical protein